MKIIIFIIQIIIFLVAIIWIITKNNIIYSTKYNNTFEINKFSHTKKITLTEQIIIVLRSILLIRLKN